MSKLSRGEFIKASIVGGLGLLFPPNIIGEYKEKSPELEVDWQTTPFFKNIEVFDSNLLPLITRDLNIFGDKYGELIKNNLQPEYAIEKYRKTVEIAVHRLERIYETYKKIETYGEQDDVSFDLINRDFQYVASSIWSVLAVGERFKHKKEELATLLQMAKKEELVSETIESHFLGEHIFEIEEYWSSFKYSNSECDQAIAVMMDDEGLDWTTSSKEWLDQRGKKNLHKYQSDPEKPDRPAKQKIEIQDEELKRKIQHKMEEAGLSRVGIDFKFTEIENGYEGGYDTLAREIFIDYPGKKEDERYPFILLLLQVVYHEAFHDIDWQLIPHIQSDIDRFRVRVRIEKALKKFRPHTSLKKYFQPEGAFHSLVTVNEYDDLYTKDAFLKRNNVFNESSVTDYAASKNLTGDAAKRFMHNISSIYFKKDIPKNESFVSRILERVDITHKTDREEFSDYFDRVYKSIFLSGELDNCNKLELAVFSFIKDNKKLFDAKERRTYYTSKYLHGYNYYLVNEVVPMVIKELILKDTSLFTDLFKDRKIIEKKAVKQAYRILLKRLKNDYSDGELMPDIFAFNLVRKEIGAKNEITEKEWAAVDLAFTRTMYTLYSDGLAIQESRQESLV